MSDEQDSRRSTTSDEPAAPSSARLRPVRLPKDLGVVRPLFVDYRRWLADHGDPSPDATERVRAGLAMVDDLIARLPEVYVPPHGDLLVWFQGDAIVACGALRTLEAGVGELRRVYIRPDHQGMEFGIPFGTAVMARAREFRLERLRVDTLGTMRGAIEFYDALGFHPIPAFWPHPAAGALFFERDLGATNRRPEPARRAARK